MTSRESSPPEPAPAPQLDVFEKTRSTWGFPSFARDFPNDPELAVLVAAFAAGDYATVRIGAPELASKTDDERREACRRAPSHAHRAGSDVARCSSR